MKSIPLILSVFLTLIGGPSALAFTWQPSPGHTQIQIWPGKAPDPQPVPGPEDTRTVTDSPVAGKTWTWIENVSVPTMTVYSPTGKNTGAAMVVLPGGGYLGLAIDLEGTEICDWMTTKGITCVVLKYRVPADLKEPYRESPMALQDAQRTLGLLRSRASEFNIDPHKIGVIGFSAGGHLGPALSTHYDERTYTAVDAADKESCRPDFVVALYPGHLSVKPNIYELNPHIQVTANTPPTFLLQSENDPVDRVENSLVYFTALRKAGVVAEMHLFAHGGHAFGLRHTEEPITDWPPLVEAWLKSIGMTSK